MKLLAKHLNLVIMMLVVATAIVMPEIAMAQENPFLSGMRNQNVIRIAQIVLYAVALLMFVGEGLPALKKGDLAESLKVGFGIALLVAAAVKLRDIVDIFAQISG